MGPSRVYPGKFDKGTVGLHGYAPIHASVVGENTQSINQRVVPVRWDGATVQSRRSLRGYEIVKKPDSGGFTLRPPAGMARLVPPPMRGQPATLVEWGLIFFHRARDSKSPLLRIHREG